MNKERTDEFYLALDRIFDLQFGKLLLRILSKAELESLILNGMPYFYNYQSEIDCCLNGVTCKELLKIIQMGKFDTIALE